MRTSRNNNRGGILLAVLWLSVALAAIAFSLATTVRGETERSSTLADAIRARYLAQAGVDRAILQFVSKPQLILPPRVPLMFPSGMAMVEIIPETARLSLNQGRPDQFVRLLLALGATPERAQEIAAAIVDWRGGSRAFDQYYLSLTPSFLPRHASFQDVEEAIYLRGMTPELFHGTYVRDPQGRLIRQSGFKDCVSPYGSIGPFDVNHSEPPLLASQGFPPDTVQQIVELRRRQPLVNMAALAGIGVAPTNLRVGGHTIYTFRSTGRVYMPNAGPNGPLSDVARTVSAMVKFRKPDLGPPPYQIIRWWEPAESPMATPAEVSLWK